MTFLIIVGFFITVSTIAYILMQDNKKYKYYPEHDCWFEEEESE